MIKLRAGKKTDEKESPFVSYSLYDRCDICPLRVYMDVVLNDNLSSLIIEGKADESVLKRTKSHLISEFAELSGNEYMLSLKTRLQQIYTLRTQITYIDVCTSLKDEIDVSGYLSDMKLNPKNIASVRASKVLRLKEAVSKFDKLVNEVHPKETSGANFHTQLVILSKHMGFRITPDIMLSEYAAYLKIYTEYVKFNDTQQ